MCRMTCGIRQQWECVVSRQLMMTCPVVSKPIRLAIGGSWLLIVGPYCSGLYLDIESNNIDYIYDVISTSNALVALQKRWHGIGGRKILKSRGSRCLI